MAKILIIDDEEQLRKLLARIIALEGYEVAEAADCAGPKISSGVENRDIRYSKP